MTIPIFIISYNRPTPLKALVNRLHELGQERLIVLDNASNYPPLMEYYGQIEKEVEIVRLKENFGSKVLQGHLWDDLSFREKYKLDRSYYAYTDVDIVPDEGCPKDFLDKFMSILMMDSWPRKVGFGLRIDDLPDSFEAKADLITWEGQFWKEKVDDRGLNIPLFRAAIDTTFAVRRPGSSPGWTGYAYRSGPPYVARHLPWYIDTARLTEEEENYVKTMRPPVMGCESHFPGRYVKHAEVIRGQE